MKFEEVEPYYQETLSEAEAILNYYPPRRRKYRFYSQLIRLGTILLVSIGGVMPLVDLAWQENSYPLVSFGYVAFSLAASLFLLDKYFGYSTGWMRFMMAEVEIKNVINQHQNDWIFYKIKFGGKELTEEELMKILAFNKRFSTSVSHLEIAETKAWILEFQSTYQSLEEMINANKQGTTNSIKTPDSQTGS